MEPGTLWFSLGAGGIGAVLVWFATRALSARLRTNHDRAPAGAGPVPQPAAVKPNDAKPTPQAEAIITPESVQAVYRRVLVRRVGGLALCLVAFMAWMGGLNPFFCLIPAAAGCVLQYLAYRLRTCYALRIARQKREQENAALAKSGLHFPKADISKPDSLKSDLDKQDFGKQEQPLSCLVNTSTRPTTSQSS